MIDFPKTAEDIPTVTDLWAENCDYARAEERARMAAEDIAKLLFVDKTRLLNAVAVMQASIIYRAVAACDMYFEWQKKANESGDRSYIRPRIRVDKRYGTVEMSWVRRLSKSSPTKPGDHFDSRESIGRGKQFRIMTDKGSQTVFIWYSRLKTLKSGDYGVSIFKNEPAIIQKLGPIVESKLSLLRKEQKALNEIKRHIRTINGAQNDSFTDKVQEELMKWTEGKPLTALYSVISMDQDSDQGEFNAA